MRTEWNPRFFSTKNFHIDPDPQGMKSRDYTTNGGWDPKNRTDTWFITVRCSFSSPKTWGFGTPDPNGRTLWLINGGVILATYYNLDDPPRTPPPTKWPRFVGMALLQAVWQIYHFILGIRCICTCDGENQLLEDEIFAFDASSAYFEGRTCCFVSGEGM